MSIAVSSEQREAFARDGFAVLPGAVPRAVTERLADRFEALFSGRFDTDVYPDEWYWRPGMSLPDVTRHMANAWKSDRAVASLVLSASIGRLAAELAGFSAARIGQDTLWWKPPSGKPIALHQDDTYVASLDPPHMVTCWIALDDTVEDGGTIEYVPGSHRWTLKEQRGEFHAPPGDYRAEMRRAAAAAGVEDPRAVHVAVTAGTVVVHDGRIWHGSGPNAHGDRMRRSIGVHLLAPDVRYREGRAGYIYGRYKRPGSLELDEAFFPVSWSESGYRTPWLAGYCEDALG